MALIGVHFILIFLGLDLIQTKKFLVETEGLEKVEIFMFKKIGVFWRPFSNMKFA